MKKTLRQLSLFMYFSHTVPEETMGQMKRSRSGKFNVDIYKTQGSNTQRRGF
jgi:hypothetical protein